MQPFPTLFNKTSDDFPEILDENSMIDICNQHEIDYEYHKNYRRSLIRFYPIKSEFKGQEYFTKVSSHFGFDELRYYWDGERYIKRTPTSNLRFKFSPEHDCYGCFGLKYYVYVSVGDDGRLYVGSYTSWDDFENDDYYGSFTDETFKPIKKIKICECSTRNEAYEKEHELQTMLGVDSNPDFANKCIETTTVLGS